MPPTNAQNTSEFGIRDAERNSSPPVNPGHQRPRHQFFQQCSQQLREPSRDIIFRISVGSERVVHDVVMERRSMGSKAGDDFVVQ